MFMSGLRTLCLAVADIDDLTYKNWSKIYQEASTAINDRERLLEEAAELIERVHKYSHIMSIYTSFWFFGCMVV